jgi:LmbE family N-acetylglucosaminyl deacetylase
LKYLIVVAHPDDEVLGAGATIRKLIEEGNEVAVCTMANHAAARANISNTLDEDQKNAMDILGVKNTYSADFPNIKMNTVPHLDLVHFIELCIEDFQAEAIITNHPSDLNNDHVITSYAAQVASRLSQRRDGIPRLRLLAYMEVVSSTEWSFDSSHNHFVPNLFIEIGEQGLDLKIRALEMYKGVVRDYPHPRSDKGIRALAAWRGSQAGCNYAEAFECVFRCV